MTDGAEVSEREKEILKPVTSVSRLLLADLLCFLETKQLYDTDSHNSPGLFQERENARVTFTLVFR